MQTGDRTLHTEGLMKFHGHKRKSSVWKCFRGEIENSDRNLKRNEFINEIISKIEIII